MPSIQELGFTPIDGLTLFLSIVAAVLGSGADYLLRRDDLQKLPRREKQPMHWTRWSPLLFARIAYLGPVSGLAVWLLLYGSLASGPIAVCKLLLISLWAGFTTPQIAAQLQNHPPKVQPSDS